MGNRSKSTRKEKAQESLKEETAEAVEMKTLIKDERTHKIFGALSLLFCFFLFVSFTSYLFTWKEDQDMVRNTGIKILFPNELEISNQLGSLGAYTAFVFFEYGFGIASFLFCSFFFVVGVNFLFGKKVFSIWRNLRYVLVGIVVISISASFFAGDVIDICDDAFFDTHGKPDVIITDPPRAGMHDKLVKKLLEIQAPLIVYVSCNPATQARDLSLLGEKYTVTKIQPVDMFPHTLHIENVVQLKRTDLL